jgi:hypothetical protein
VADRLALRMRPYPTIASAVSGHGLGTGEVKTAAALGRSSTWLHRLLGQPSSHAHVRLPSRRDRPRQVAVLSRPSGESRPPLTGQELAASRHLPLSSGRTACPRATSGPASASGRRLMECLMNSNCRANQQRPDDPCAREINRSARDGGAAGAPIESPAQARCGGNIIVLGRGIHVTRT